MSRNAGTKVMTNDGQSELTPKLRFPEFCGQSVREVELKDVTAESTTRNGETLPATSVMGVSKVYGIVPMEERIISSTIARYKLVQKDWFAYNPMRLNIGSIARWQGKSDILVSPDYVVFRCLNEAESGLHPAFLDQFRQSVAWEDFVKHGGDGSVRVRIYYEDIGRLPLLLPTMSEQQKIADCLIAVDDLIANQTRKVDALRTHKKGLMQKLFPREDETRPGLRFPEFQNAGEWEEGQVADIGTVLQGFGFPERHQGLKSGDYPFYKVSDISKSLDAGKVFIEVSANYINGSLLKGLGAKPIPSGTTIFAKIGEAIRSNKRASRPSRA
jgi:type I restriction enzyme, S subunit